MKESQEDKWWTQGHRGLARLGPAGLSRAERTQWLLRPVPGLWATNVCTQIPDPPPVPGLGLPLCQMGTALAWTSRAVWEQPADPSHAGP